MSNQTGKLRRPTKTQRGRGQNGKFIKVANVPVNSDVRPTKRRNIYSQTPPATTPDLLTESTGTQSDNIDNNDVNRSPARTILSSPARSASPAGKKVTSQDVDTEDASTKVLPRKRRGIKSRTVCYPRVLYPAHEAAERRKRWQQRWDQKPENPSSIEEMLRSSFWGNSDAKPRCYSCKVSQAALAAGEDAPDGTEEKELLPCGCLYEASLLEMWCVKKGMFIDAELERSELEAAGKWVEHIGPKTLGKHKMLLLRFWEMLFGPFDISTLLNLRGQREVMLKKFCDNEENSMSQLKPNPGYIQRIKLRNNGKKRKRLGVSA